MKRLSLVILLFVFDVYCTTLEEALVAAYNNNASWIASQINKNIAEQEKKIAEFGFFPVITGSLSSSRSAQEIETSVRPLESLSTTNAGTNTEMGVQIRQNLFKGFQTVNNIKSKDNNAKAQYYAMLKAKSDLLARVIVAYVDIWVRKQALNAYVKKEENLKKLYEAQVISLEAGVSTPVEVEEAKSKYEIAHYDRINAKNRLIQAEQSFEYLTGLHLKTDVLFPSLNIKDMPKNIEDFKKNVRESNPEILQYKFLALSAENEYSVAKAEIGPSIDASLSASKSLHKPEGYKNRTYTKQEKSYGAQLTLSMPLFNMQTYGQIRLYSERAKAAEFRAKDKLSEVMSSCEVFYDRLNMAEASIKSTRAAVKSAEIASGSNLDAVTLGVKSNTEFLDSENTLLNARINFAETLKTKIEAILQIHALLGKLDLQTILTALKKNYNKKISK